MANRDFARIVTASNGQQVLFYVQPQGDTWLIHQIVCLDGAQADMVLDIKAQKEMTGQEFEDMVFGMFEEEATVATADALVAEVDKLWNMPGEPE